MRSPDHVGQKEDGIDPMVLLVESAEGETDSVGMTHGSMPQLIPSSSDPKSARPGSIPSLRPESESEDECGAEDLFYKLMGQKLPD